MLAFGFNKWTDSSYYRRKTLLVAGGTWPQVLAGSMAIAASTLSHCATYIDHFFVNCQTRFCLILIAQNWEESHAQIQVPWVNYKKVSFRKLFVNLFYFTLLTKRWCKLIRNGSRIPFRIRRLYYISLFSSILFYISTVWTKSSQLNRWLGPCVNVSSILSNFRLGGRCLSYRKLADKFIGDISISYKGRTIVYNL